MASSETGTGSQRSWDERRFALMLILLIAGIDGLFYHAGGWNQYARLAGSVAFVEPGTPYTATFRIDGLRGDPSRLATEDWAEWNGALYSNKAPGVSFLGVVPYYLLYYAERALGVDPKTERSTANNMWALNQWLSTFWNIVAALALIRRLPRLGVHSREGAALVALVYSCATMVLPYGCSAWGHQTAAAFITLGTLDLADESRARPARAGFWLGMALLTEYLAGVSLVLAAVYVLAGPDRSERLWRLGTGSAAPVAALLVYQELAFGSYFTTATSLSNPVFLQAGKAVGLFGTPSPDRLLGILVTPEHGLLWQMPVLILSACGIAPWFKTGRRAYPSFLTANIVAYVLLLTAIDAYQGGLTTSMRYLIIALPFFCLLLPDFRTFAWRKTFLGMFAASAANMFVLAATSTMYGGEFPLSDFAYPDFLKGALRLNPWLSQIAPVPGTAVALALAAVYGSALVWLLRSALASSAERISA